MVVTAAADVSGYGGIGGLVEMSLWYFDLVRFVLGGILVWLQNG